MADSEPGAKEALPTAVSEGSGVACAEAEAVGAPTEAVAPAGSLGVGVGAPLGDSARGGEGVGTPTEALGCSVGAPEAVALGEGASLPLGGPPLTEGGAVPPGVGVATSPLALGSVEPLLEGLPRRVAPALVEAPREVIGGGEAEGERVSPPALLREGASLGAPPLEGVGLPCPGDSERSGEREARAEEEPPPPTLPDEDSEGALEGNPEGEGGTVGVAAAVVVGEAVSTALLLAQGEAEVERAGDADAAALPLAAALLLPLARKGEGEDVPEALRGADAEPQSEEPAEGVGGAEKEPAEGVGGDDKEAPPRGEGEGSGEGEALPLGVPLPLLLRMAV